MLCESCGKQPATVHLTDIVNKKKHELHLCEECARKKELIPATSTGVPLNLEALISLIMVPAGVQETDTSSLVCPTCGLSYAAFRAQGRLGCPDDYEAFRPALLPLLERIHRNVVHQGKTPRHATWRESRIAELDQLRTELAAAIAAEQFEEAARIRDRIRHKETADEPR